MPITWGNAAVADKPANRSTSVVFTAVAHAQGAAAATLDGQLVWRNGPAVPFTLSITAVSSASLRFALNVAAAPTDVGLNRVCLTYGMHPAKDEAVWGFGSQYTHFNTRGRKVPILISEQGVGRGLQPVTLAMDLFGHGAGGTWATTYGALPHYITSQNRSLFLESSAYSTFDLTADDRADVCVMLATSSTGLQGRPLSLAWRVVADTRPRGGPLALIEEYALTWAGTMAPVPQWASGGGAILGMEGGTAAVLAKWRNFTAASVPLAAVWIQDWSGERVDSFGTRLWWNWEVDLDHYPDWTGLIANLSAAEPPVRLMTYINPNLADTVAADKPNHRRDLFAEARDKGFLVRNASGEPYIQASGSAAFTFASVDFTNPNATAWFADVIRCNMLLQGKSPDGQPCTAGLGTASGPSVGVGGWMSDFGEYLPFDAQLHSGAAALQHNAYPQQWAACNAQGIAAAGKTGETVPFARSAWSQSPAMGATVFWMGDQLVTWDNDDGMASALTGMLSWGVSGMSLASTDIGGYTMLNDVGGMLKYARSKELLMRWMEMSAFSDVIFRSHPGNLPNMSWQVDSDAETLAHFAAFARVHAALYPYRSAVMREAHDTGAPHTRHTLLHFPVDGGAAAAGSQFMVGPMLLVAPVLTEGATSVTAYLPAHSGKSVAVAPWQLKGTALTPLSPWLPCPRRGVDARVERQHNGGDRADGRECVRCGAERAAGAVAARRTARRRGKIRRLLRRRPAPRAVRRRRAAVLRRPRGISRDNLRRRLRRSTAGRLPHQGARSAGPHSGAELRRLPWVAPAAAAAGARRATEIVH